MKCFVKRFLPFFLTFSVGLLVASFFVAVAAPNFQFRREGKYRKYYRMKAENERLRRENQRLERRLAEMRNAESETMIELTVPPPPMPPLPPPPLVAPRRVER